MRSRYDFMKPAKHPENRTKGGTPYADVMSFEIENFEYTRQPERHEVERRDIERFDLLMFKKYNLAVYDDIVLWLNNVPSIHFLEPGDEILLPVRSDLDRFYTRFSD